MPVPAASGRPKVSSPVPPVSGFRPWPNMDPDRNPEEAREYAQFVAKPPATKCRFFCPRLSNLSRVVGCCQRLTSKLCFFSQSFFVLLPTILDRRAATSFLLLCR